MEMWSGQDEQANVILMKYWCASSLVLLMDEWSKFGDIALPISATERLGLYQYSLLLFCPTELSRAVSKESPGRPAGSLHLSKPTSTPKKAQLLSWSFQMCRFREIESSVI